MLSCPVFKIWKQRFGGFKKRLYIKLTVVTARMQMDWLFITRFAFKDQVNYLSFRQISPSRNYYDFVIKMIHGSQSGGFDDFLGDDSIINEYEPENDNIWDNQGSYFDDDSLIRLSESAFTDEGYYTFTFDTATLDYVQGVYCVLYYDNGSKYYYLGVDNNVWVDWDTGRVEDNFYGEWLSLPDGQPLNMNIIFEGDDYNLYSVPILLNGKETICGFAGIII